nr:hypothetical protein [Lysinibacillus timonensis]
MHYKNKSFNWILVISVIVIAPIIVWLTPIIISGLFFEHSNKIAFITYGKSFVMYTLSFTVALITLFILHFINKVIIKVFTSFMALILIFILYITGIQHYVYLDEEFIEYNPLFGETTKYNWSSIIRVVHELPTEEYEEKYIFEFKDGSYFELQPPNNISLDVKTRIYDKIMTLDAPYEEY